MEVFSNQVHLWLLIADPIKYTTSVVQEKKSDKVNQHKNQDLLSLHFHKYLQY